MIKVFQIYFDPSQLGSLEKEYIPHLNAACTPFFENTVIRSLVDQGQHKGCDYFGVVSWKLRHKLSYTKNWPLKNIANRSTREFSPALFHAELIKHRPDVMSFQRHLPHDPITFADRFHPKFSDLFRRIMMEIGYSWSSERFENVFYCNYFVATPEFYHAYVSEMLAPAMDVMSTMPELMNNSHYPEPLPDNLKDSFGITHYPYHTFLCERMFSYYAHLKKLKCLHY